MWAIIPNILRVGHDVDPIQCMHWQPSVEDLPECLASYYVEQSRVFAKKILMLAPQLRSTLLAEHTHGVTKVPYQAIETDGVALYWVMVQLYHPLNREHRRTLELEIMRFPAKFAHGNPTPLLTKLREKLQEGLDIMLKIRWETTAIPLIDILGRRDPLFAVKLEKHRALPNDPDDSAVDMGKLLRDVASVVGTLDGAHKNWDEGGASKAMSAKDTNSSEFKELRSELQQLKNALASQSGPRNGAKNTPRPPLGMCQVVGCTRKVEGYNKTNNWLICATHLLEYKGGSGPLQLVDGSKWGKERVKTLLAAMRQAKVIKTTRGQKRRAHRASQRAGKEEGPESSLGEQDGQQTPRPNGKKAKAAVASAKAARRKAEFLSLM